MKYYLLVVLAINATIADANPHLIECDITKLSHESLIAKYYMDINNKTELHTHQGVDLSQLQISQLNIERTLFKTKHCY